VRVDQVEGRLRKRQLLGVGDVKLARQPLLGKIRPSEPDGRRSDIDSEGPRPTAGESRKIDTRTAADLEHGAPTVAAEVDQPGQMVKLLEMVLLKIIEEAPRSDRVPRDIEIVDVSLPVAANFVDARHAG